MEHPAETMFTAKEVIDVLPPYVIIHVCGRTSGMEIAWLFLVRHSRCTEARRFETTVLKLHQELCEVHNHRSRASLESRPFVVRRCSTLVSYPPHSPKHLSARNRLIAL